jgi:MFS family permease
MPRESGAESVQLGLRQNLGQFTLLVAINALVGGMVGQERALLPVLATDIFGLADTVTILTFLLAFGVTKAVANAIAGALVDRFGRKRVLVVGWVVGLPVPLLLIWAPSWEWIVAANVLLGVNQGFTWSTTVIMKIDLIGPGRRGLAMGLNEASGYGAVALTALATGAIAQEAGLRPAPFLLGLAYAGLGFAASAFLVRETAPYAAQERAARAGPAAHHIRSPRMHARHAPGWTDVLARTTIHDPSLSAACLAGLVNNMNDALAWGLLPLYFAAAGLQVAEIAVLAATYPAVWAIGQIGTGALSDRIGRKGLIVCGMLVQAAGLGIVAVGSSLGIWMVAAAILGIGTAMVYPTLLAAVADVADPEWRGAAIGVYRFWRDLGFAVGGIVAGVIAEAAGFASAIRVVAVLTAASGLVALVRMRETRQSRPGRPAST